MTDKCTGVIVGKWSIVDTPGWGFVERGFGTLEIRSDGYGDIQLDLLDASIQGEIGHFKVGFIFDFTFDGEWECDHCFGQGELEIASLTELHGVLKIHDGDEIEFKAKKII